mgnify:CR=1 FL=1
MIFVICYSQTFPINILVWLKQCICVTFLKDILGKVPLAKADYCLVVIFKNAAGCFHSFLEFRGYADIILLAFALGKLDSQWLMEQNSSMIDGTPSIFTSSAQINRTDCCRKMTEYNFGKK